MLETDPAARQSRSAFERLVAMRPDVLAALVQSSFRLPAAAGYSVQRRFFSRAYAAFNRRDWEMNTLLFHPESYVLEWASEGLLMPDLEKPLWHGREGYLAAMAVVTDMWPDMRIWLEDLRQVGDERLLTADHILGRSGSGPAVEERFTELYEFSDGRLVRQVTFLHRADALAAAGLDADPFAAPPGGWDGAEGATSSTSRLVSGATRDGRPR